MIEMSEVVKRFGGDEVLSSVTFSVKRGEIFGMLGPSGAGKTTIINILTGQLDADGGYYETGASALETGLMLDADGLYERLGCLDNLYVFTAIYGLPKSRAAAALRRVGLTGNEKKPVSALSKGMRQRLALARAIIHQPKVLFLDEPTSGLDPSTARGIHELILDLRDNDATVFLTTHNMDEAVRLCDRVVLLHEGWIVEQGEPSEICERHNAFKTVPDLESVFIKLTGVALE